MTALFLFFFLLPSSFFFFLFFFRLLSLRLFFPALVPPSPPLPAVHTRRRTIGPSAAGAAGKLPTTPPSRASRPAATRPARRGARSIHAAMASLCCSSPPRACRAPARPRARPPPHLARRPRRPAAAAKSNITARSRCLNFGPDVQIWIHGRTRNDQIWPGGRQWRFSGSHQQHLRG